MFVVALVFLLPWSSWGGVKYKVLHNFGTGSDGAIPYGPLTSDGRGGLYGNTISGGTGCPGYGCGTAYELEAGANGAWKESVLYDFPGGDYAYPWGGLILDGSGNLYGTMQGYRGGVFQLSPGSDGWAFAPLYTDGAGPGLLMDGTGDLYGAMGPGQLQAGAIAELSPGSNGWNYGQIYSFCSGNSCPDGVDPPAPPIWDGKGNMFGTTIEGGIYKSPCSTWTRGCGVIYEMTPNGDGTWSYYVLHRFASFKTDGQSPYSGLVMDAAGNFYGATWFGGSHQSGGYGNGTVFKLAYSGGRWKETVLYDFPDCAYGCRVEGTLARDKAGNLYGTASGGSGNCGYSCGVVFKLSPRKNGKWGYRVVYNFTPKGGGLQPFYGVILDDKGHLFGVTSQFGKYGAGTAFEITP